MQPDPDIVRVRLEGRPESSTVFFAWMSEAVSTAPEICLQERSRFYPNRRGDCSRGRVYLTFTVLPASSGQD